MGLAPHYRLIPKHTACWCKACSHLQCRWECLCWACVPSWPFFRPLHWMLLSWGCLNLSWMAAYSRRRCSFLLAYTVLLLLSPFLCVLISVRHHLSPSESLHHDVSLLSDSFFIFHCFSALSIVLHAHGHLMRAAVCVGVAWWQRMWLSLSRGNLEG